MLNVGYVQNILW